MDINEFFSDFGFRDTKLTPTTRADIEFFLKFNLAVLIFARENGKQEVAVVSSNKTLVQKFLSAGGKREAGRPFVLKKTSDLKTFDFYRGHTFSIPKTMKWTFLPKHLPITEENCDKISEKLRQISSLGKITFRKKPSGGRDKK